MITFSVGFQHLIDKEKEVTNYRIFCLNTRESGR